MFVLVNLSNITKIACCSDRFTICLKKLVMSGSFPNENNSPIVHINFSKEVLNVLYRHNHDIFNKIELILQLKGNNLKYKVH